MVRLRWSMFGIKTNLLYQLINNSVYSQGYKGTQGFDGVKGLDGCNGTDGKPGVPGYPGTPGERGPPGPDGLKGSQGIAGDGGANSPRIKGDYGEPGYDGAKVRIINYLRMSHIRKHRALDNNIFLYFKGLPGPQGITGSYGSPGTTGDEVSYACISFLGIKYTTLQK